MRIGLDATPLLGRRTGIGHYVAQLLAALAKGDDELVATAFTFRGRGGLEVPRGVRVASRPAPAQLLQQAWAHLEWPPAELLSGSCDIFHATNFVLPPLARARGVVTIHDLAYLHLTGTVSTASARYRSLVPRSVRRASIVITPSGAVAAQVRDAYDPAVPVVVVPHGVDPAWAEAVPATATLRARLGLPTSYVVFVGTLEPRKDVATLLAAHRLTPQAPPLVLVGPAGWGEQVDVTGCVTPGYLDGPALRSVVAGASALVLPSLDEGFGLPVLEALAAGVPVVTSDLPALREVGGEVARYAPAGDAEAFAAALSGVLAFPPAADTLRAQAADFTWARSATGHRAAYRLALR